MAKSAQQRLNGPEILDLDPDTGKPYAEDFDTSSLESDQDRLLNDIIGEFGASDNEVSYRASITRIPKGFQRGQKEPWLFECDAAEIIGIRTRLRDQYRGGLFRIRVYRTGEKGTKLYRQMDYSIETPEIATAQAGDPRIDALSAGFERLLNQNTQLMERLSTPAVISGPPAVALDPFTMMEKMSVIFANMMPKASAGGADLDMFLKATTLVSELKGDSGGGNEDNIYSVIRAIASNPALGDVLKQRGQAPMQGQRRIPGPQNGQMPMQGRRQMQQPQHEIPQPVSGNDPKSLGDALQSNMRYLIVKAEQDRDPALYADWLLDNTDFNILMPMLNDPNLLNQLCSAFPRMVPVRNWFEQLVSFAKQAIGENAGDQMHNMNGENDAPGGTGSNTHENPGGGGGDQDHLAPDGQAGA